MAARFHGSIPALITPFSGGKVDEASLRKLVDWHIAEGTHGLVPVGTTGESPTLSHDEHKQVVEIVVDQVAGRIPVIAGAGSNSTAEAVDFAVHASEAGADAALSVVPYYNKPTQEGLYQHFAAVARAVPDLPIIRLQRAGPHGGFNISVETLDRLAKDFANIVGVKDATADLTRPVAAAAGVRRGLHSAVRRRRHRACLQCPWRHGLHLGHGQRGAAAVCRVPGSNAGRRLCQGADAAGPADAAAQGAVLRNQPGAGQVCRQPAGPCAGRGAAADGAGHGGCARQQVKAAMVHAGLLN